MRSPRRAAPSSRWYGVQKRTRRSAVGVPSPTGSHDSGAHRATEGSAAIRRPERSDLGITAPIASDRRERGNLMLRTCVRRDRRVGLRPPRDGRWYQTAPRRSDRREPEQSATASRDNWHPLRATEGSAAISCYARASDEIAASGCALLAMVRSSSNTGTIRAAIRQRRLSRDTWRPLRATGGSAAISCYARASDEIAASGCALLAMGSGTTDSWTSRYPLRGTKPIPCVPITAAPSTARF